MALSDIFGIGKALIDKLIPDPAAKAAANLELIRLEQAGELDMVKAQLSAIIAEANSTDPWTSRARPTFMYVMYLLILWAIPMGLVSAFRPDMALAIGKGMTTYLAAIPDSLYALFGTGYLGYAASRTFDKHIEAKKR